MRIFRTLLLSACAAGLLAGCGGSGTSGGSVNTSTTRGTLIQNPPLRTASVTATDFTSQLNATSAGPGLLQVAGAPTCGIDFHYIQYATVGGAGEATTATGVLMVPTALPTDSQLTKSQCTGPRPIVLYAHGTTTVKSFNLAAISDQTNDANGESALIAAMFAAQGYIVVAPNYAGYDASTLPYHPYLNADQQSKDMIDSLTAARSALGHIYASGTTDSGKLFITGYSQGGHVAMATQQAMEALYATGSHPEMKVTAAAPMSGPYAMEAFGDAILFGSVDLGSTVFIPMITTSYQNSYGGIYNSTSDIYESTYATGIDTLLPSNTPLNTLFAQNKLPQLWLFNGSTPVTGTALDTYLAVPTNPLFAAGFSPANLVTPGNLVKNSVRIAYASDAVARPDGAVPAPTAGVPLASTTNGSYPLRAKLNLNDMRYVRYGSVGFVPQNPTLLCGGSNDPTVFFSVNAGTMQAFWAPMNLPNGLVTVLDLETGLGASDPFTVAEAGFALEKTALATDLAQNPDHYHSVLVPPFCTAAARGFFSQF